MQNFDISLKWNAIHAPFCDTIIGHGLTTRMRKKHARNKRTNVITMKSEPSWAVETIHEG